MKDSSVGIIKLRLGACLTGPTRRMVADLDRASELCGLIKTAMVRAWERWREDHPEWTPEPVMKDDAPVLDRNGQPILRNYPLPAKMPVDRQVRCRSCKSSGRKDGLPCERCRGIGYVKHVSGATWLGELATHEYPGLAAKIVSTLGQDVYSDLCDKMPYNHAGQAKYRWQGPLMNEAHRACYRWQPIPVPCQDSALAYVGFLSTKLSPGVAARVAACGKSSAVIRFPLWSRESGRDELACIARVEVRQLTAGNRRLLRRIAIGEWPLCDSTLVYHGDRDDRKRKRSGDGWYLHLVYRQPAKDLGLDATKPATLSLLPADATHPMQIAAEGCKTWTLGSAKVLLAQLDRLDMRRQANRLKYRQADQLRGRGRRPFYQRMRPLTRASQNLLGMFTKNLVAEVIKYCERNDCGQLIYREPGLMLRQKDWFAEHWTNFDWTDFLSRLQHKCTELGVELVVQRMSTKEYRAGA